MTISFTYNHATAVSKSALQNTGYNLPMNAGLSHDP
jgi:hypothetical protein